MEAGQLTVMNVDDEKPSYNRLTETLVQVVIEGKDGPVLAWVVTDATHFIATTVTRIKSLFQ